MTSPDHFTTPEPWEQDAETDRIIDGVVPVVLVGFGAMVILGAIGIGALIAVWKAI